MHRAALLAFGTLLASAGLAAGQGLPEGTFASSKEGCAKLKQKTAAELGQDLDFTVLSKAGITANLQRCDFVTVTARNATSWLATAFCEEPLCLSRSFRHHSEGEWRSQRHADDGATGVFR